MSASERPNRILLDRAIGPKRAITRVVGVDIGGANLKYAVADGRGFSRPFPMWTDHRSLFKVLAIDLERCSAEYGGPVGGLAVTMTGELADCFVDRAHGVEFIVDATLRAASLAAIREIGFYALPGEWIDAKAAKQRVDDVAAANWHASASWVASTIRRDGLMVDIGSTTTDIIPFRRGRVACDARTDFDRLIAGNLVYVGSRRTPVCALVDSLDDRGRTVPVMNEVFATVDDARLILGVAAEDPADSATADGRPRTVAMAINRMSRMVGLDRRHVDGPRVSAWSEQVIAAARGQIAEPIKRHRGSGPMIPFGSGQEMLPAGERCDVLTGPTADELVNSQAISARAVAALFAVDGVGVR